MRRWTSLQTESIWTKATSCADRTRSYDNFMLLRGALFASQRFSVTRATQDLIIEHGIKSTVTHVSTGIKPTDSSILGKPIDNPTAKKYGY